MECSMRATTSSGHAECQSCRHTVLLSMSPARRDTEVQRLDHCATSRLVEAEDRDGIDDAVKWKMEHRSERTMRLGLNVGISEPPDGDVRPIVVRCREKPC